MWDWLSKLNELGETQTPHTLVTVVKCQGSSPRDVGAKMVVLADGTVFGTVGGGSIEKLAIVKARECLEDGVSQTVSYHLDEDAGMHCGGTMELFIEVFNQGPKLYLFGAGHVGQAVCRVLAGTSFSVHLVDDREDWIHSEQLPKTAIRHACSWDEFIGKASWDSKQTYVAIMTHTHGMDENILKNVLGHPAAYVGMIGSKSKWQQMKKKLMHEGVAEEDLARVKCPIGLEIISGKSPQEIAISVAAEILKLHYEK